MGFSPFQIIFQPLHRHKCPGHPLQFRRCQALPLFRYGEYLPDALQGNQRGCAAFFQHLPAFRGLPQPCGQFHFRQNHTGILYGFPGRFRQGAFCPFLFYFVKFQTDFRLFHFFTPFLRGLLRMSSLWMPRRHKLGIESFQFSIFYPISFRRFRSGFHLMNWHYYNAGFLFSIQLP